MNVKSTQQKVSLDRLILDKENPRFAELYSGSEKEDEIIEYLLYTESAEDIAVAISSANEFYPDRPLWVLKVGDNYLVKDGNRRCAAVKALKHPAKYGLELEKIDLNELPVLVYNNESDIINRIRQEHTSNLFRQWSRIAKALDVHRLYISGNSLESMREYDSSPIDLIRLASFYYESVKICSDDLKKLLRSKKEKAGGKTIIFERLFRFRNECGYTFKNKSTNEILIKDYKLFSSYIIAMVKFLQDDPDVTSRTVDVELGNFLDRLKPYGFPPMDIFSQAEDLTEESENNSDTDVTGNNYANQDSSNNSAENIVQDNNLKVNTDDKKNQNNSSGSNQNGRKSIKHRPTYNRKKIPSPLERLIKECYDLDQNNFANAKTALVRVTFECTLKFIIENTNQRNGKCLAKSNHFRTAYFNSKGEKFTYTNFETLKNKFTELILDTGIKKAFENFDLQRLHQIIHNYHVGAIPADAKGICDNLIILLEFMLQDENELLASIDSSKF